MKKILLLGWGLGLLAACSSDNVRYRNPYLPDYSFSVTIDENLPTNSGLTIPMNPVYINNGTSGVSGIIVMRVSSTDYRAWEAACPNEAPKPCSTMDIDGLNAVCTCTEPNHTYSLFDGTGPYQYTMRPYRVEVIDDRHIRVYN
ncbi:MULTISPECIES: hypothetical protein [unclassified Flavobacterium]|uniref:hypothetical protein n=1 Tax=unclassified Flavobacterium TaxID=196869 RepID=UPI001F130FAA|nr:MULTISPECIES: hypothetical protein [unclassified Flavobacterium]UMY66065.1 hypothetical protein MKO97_01410 [Flavobacterium sp. HJ-32-4]